MLKSKGKCINGNLFTSAQSDSFYLPDLAIISLSLISSRVTKGHFIKTTIFLDDICVILLHVSLGNYTLNKF